jgi:deoxyribonuclease V
MDAIDKKYACVAKKAHEMQLKLSKHIVFEDKLVETTGYIAGVDVAYAGGISIGAVAVLNRDSFDLIESQTAICRTRFPYIPTLLSFREIPPAVLSIRKLRIRPDYFLVDGQGFAHPYGCGFASHLGLVLGKPTIGVAKSRLFGEAEDAEKEKDVVLLEHDHKVVGAVVTTKQGNKPIYVSVGHMISLNTAVQVVKSCTRNNRIPEPLLRAHIVATAEKRKIHIQSTGNK